jgi:DNA-directed RNA polymerase subunit M/transcription elongation factor TFIIS
MELIDTTKDLVSVIFNCEKCHEGFMVYHHETKIINGILHYKNRCSSCGHEEHMRAFYPTVKEREHVNDLSKPGLLLTLCSRECESWDD